MENETLLDAPASGSAPAGDPAPSGQQPSSEAGQAQGSAPDGQGAGNEQAAPQGGDPQGDGAQGGEGGAAQGAPEQYAAFTMPDGFQLDGSMLESLTATAKGLNLTQEQAQGLVDLGVAQAQAITDAFSQSPVPMAKMWHDTWVGQTKADAEIGGDKLAAVLPVAKQALTTFGTPALQELLAQTGLGSHPEMIRLLNKVGSAISEDAVHTRGGSQGGARKDTAKSLYPDMN